MDLLYCECNNLASPYCDDLKCITCCNNSNCKKHKNKKLNKLKKNKKKIKNKIKNKIKKSQECYFDNTKYYWINSEYTFEMLHEIKSILNIGVKKLIPELTDYIVDYLDNRIECAICNNKRTNEELYPCFYCKKLVCDDTCNEVKDGECFSLVYYCLQCKEYGIVSED